VENHYRGRLHGERWWGEGDKKEFINGYVMGVSVREKYY